MNHQLLQYAAYGTMTVTIFIISMMFVDPCMDTFREWKQKNVHSRRLPCYTNPKRSETES